MYLLLRQCIAWLATETGAVYLSSRWDTRLETAGYIIYDNDKSMIAITIMAAVFQPSLLQGR